MRFESYSAQCLVKFPAKGGQFLSFLVSMHQLALSEQWKVCCTLREEQLCVRMCQGIHRKIL